MKHKILYLACFLNFSILYAQYEVLEFNPSYTKEIIKKSPNKSFTIYEANEERVLDIITSQNKIQENLEVAISKTINDSIQAEKIHRDVVSLKRVTNYILQYINEFTDSKLPYDSKIENLISAQKLANLYNIESLIYADSEINAEDQEAYSDLQNNQQNLKKHLKKVVKSIKNIQVNISPNIDSIYTTIDLLRTRLSNIKIEKRSLARNLDLEKIIFTLDHKIDEITLSGSFIPVKNYFMINNDFNSSKNGTEINQIEKEKIEKENIILNQKSVLIKDTKSEKYYFVPSDLIKNINYASILKNDVDNKNTDLYIKRSISRITNLNYTLKKYESMIMRCKELTIKLGEHQNSLKNGLMNSKRMTVWKKDLDEAQLLTYQIDVYKSIYKKTNYPVEQYANKSVLKDYDVIYKELTNALRYVTDF